MPDGRATSNRVPHEANYAAIQAICEEWKQACSDDECRCAILEAGWRLGFSDAVKPGPAESVIPPAEEWDDA